MRISLCKSPKRISCTKPIPMVGFTDEHSVICDVPIGDEHWIVIGERYSGDRMRVASTAYATTCRDSTSGLEGFTPLHAALFNRFISAACAQCTE